MTAADLVRMAYARLLGLRDSLNERRKNDPQDHSVSNNFVGDFHDIIGDLESLNVDLGKFKVSDHVITRWGSTNRFVCDLDYLLSKINGLLNLFTVSQDKTKIGFINNPLISPNPN